MISIVLPKFKRKLADVAHLVSPHKLTPEIVLPY